MSSLFCRNAEIFVEMHFVPENGRFSMSSLFVEMHFVPENVQFICTI